MAFVQVETWTASPVLPAASPPMRSLSPLLEKALKNGRDLYLRRTIAIGISILVHIGLIWFLLNRIGGAADILRRGSAALTIVDLLESPASEASASAPQALPKQPATAVATKLDVSAAALPPAPEWSVSRIRVARESPPAGPGGGALASSGAGSGSGVGRGGYDPYAGAAPMRREAEIIPGPMTASLLTPSTNRDVRLNKVSLERLLRAIRARTARRGEAHLLVKISAEGAVIDVRPADPGINPALLAALINGMLGQILFVVNGDAGQATIRLSFQV